MKKLFEGIRVIDFSNNVAGPLAAAMLADFGADVIKVEKPVLGDDSRGFVPFIDGKSLSSLWVNRGKRSIVLDVKNPEGKRLFTELLQGADVLVESFRPGVMKRLGFGWEDLKDKFPRLIMYSASAFGQTGPYRDLPGYDMIAQAASGLIDITGYPDLPPSKMGPSVADYACAYSGFGGISAALFYRERSGIGQHIDISLAETGVALNDHVDLGFIDKTLSRRGNHHVLLGPYGIFNGKSGNITIAALNPNLWGKLCRLMGKEEYIDHPDFDNPGKRAIPAVQAQVTAMIEEWLGTFDSVDQAEELMRREGIPCCKIKRVQELEWDPHYSERGIICDFPTPTLSVQKVRARGNQIFMSETPAVIRPGPDVNEHADEILKEVLGYGDEEIAGLIAGGAFGSQYDPPKS